MTYFNPFQPNPIVPAQQSVAEYELVDPLSPFTFPTSNMVGENFLANTMLIEASTTGCNIVLPDARTAGTGYSFIIYNIGATNAFGVLSNTETTVYPSIAVGSPGVFFCLTDNTTQAGEWFTAAIAASTSVTNIAANAGNGLVGQVGTNTLWANIDLISTNTPITIGIDNAVNTINWTGGSDTINLPATAGTYPNAVGSGYYLYFKNSSPVNGVLTLAAPGGATIDGTPTVTLNYNESCLVIMGNSGNYHTIGLTKNNTGNAVIINSNGIQVINGTQGTPSYSFINFPSLGMYTQSGHDISFTDSNYTFLQLSSNTGIDLAAGQFYWFGIPYAYFNQCM